VKLLSVFLEAKVVGIRPLWALERDQR